MKPKEYQRRTLLTVRDFLEELAAMRAKAEKAREIDPDLGFNFVQKTWEKTAPGRQYLPRKNGMGDPLPTFCLKVPTGGGKTYLAVKTIDLINQHYRQRQTGFVLWVVPSTQIYQQTFAALKDRDHPYRRALDMASGGHTLILEKTSGFSPAYVAENLCVLMLMLPSANRQTKDQLRMFRDSGGFDRFFPDDSDSAGHQKLIARIPNLDRFDGEFALGGGQVKTSLGNTLRLLSPVIILDEGHKAYSQNAKATLEGFNPSIIVELSATPPKDANVLVDILGKELNDEEMIKLDLHVYSGSSTKWNDCLLASIEHREKLEEQARAYEAQSGNYIRPICLIQVERTGKDQRKPGLVHADDVRDYLLTYPGITAEQIAIKSSQKDELKEVDEVGGLMSPDCPIRYIITKQALQEGWDCSFAYVLTVLTNPSSKTALTQLVGRVLRQPQARKTGNHWLDESYVFCFQRKGRDVLNEIRKGFGAEGLGDLQGRVITGDDVQGSSDVIVTDEPRSQFRHAAKNLVMPAFMIKDGKEWRLVQYEADILSRIPWGTLDISPVLELKLTEVKDAGVEIRTNLEERIFDESPEFTGRELEYQSERHLDLAFAASHLLDVVPNPWRGSEYVMRAFDHFRQQYSDKVVFGNLVFILEELRKQLEVERDRLARQVFEGLLAKGTMRFMVVADDLHFNRLPKKIEYPKKEKRATREDGRPFQMSLFEHVPEDGLNSLENSVATYLDTQEMLFFWFRNVARQNYYVQGWKRSRIFSDFIMTASPENPPKDDPFNRVFVVETKGLHLKRNADTEYKRDVFSLCNKHATKADWNSLVPAMKSKVIRFEVVDQDEWQARLNEILSEATG
ncbi:DEAD/DEAH box helicase [Cerasicoccus frondis]|uniref:DEAD/DEAH box helicase n=1 Tax=Cerasicoccus frondis TaxID=490090 RepID=UPI002852CF8E|nr:DEAD/DEAH box helicase family protein [Cerasicoccus frondis]